MEDRFFHISEYLKSAPQTATKYVLYENDRTNGVIWYIPPGQEIPAHYHPETDDTWIVMQGQGQYYLEEQQWEPIEKGMVIPAEKTQVHGVKAIGEGPLVIVAISGPMPVTMIKRPS